MRMSSLVGIGAARYSACTRDRYSPAVLDETPPTHPSQPGRPGWPAVVYWCVAGTVYAALGIASPPAFLLGFWESLLFVFGATVLAPKILGRRAR